MGEITTKVFKFSQNNSGGSFDIDPKRGIGPRVFVEAVDADHANARAQAIGIYFDGRDKGMDCPCCGDRWYPASSSDEGDDIDQEYDFGWHDEVYLHRLDGTFETVKHGATP